MKAKIYILFLFVILSTPAYCQMIFDSAGNKIGYVKENNFYNGSGSKIGSTVGDQVYDGFGNTIGSIKQDNLYSSSGMKIGSVIGVVSTIGWEH
jgi:hypothetical protein